jgi:hypothetical protein
MLIVKLIPAIESRFLESISYKILKNMLIVHFSYSIFKPTNIPYSYDVMTFFENLCYSMKY